MADLAAFYTAEAKSEAPPATPTGTPPAEVAELLKKGNCESCHGKNFSIFRGSVAVSHSCSVIVRPSSPILPC